MKIIVQIDTENIEKIKVVKNAFEEDLVIIPYGDMVKISTIKDNGEIERIWDLLRDWWRLRNEVLFVILVIAKRN